MAILFPFLQPIVLEKKGIAILGSTGSIGTQTIEVIRSQPEHFTVELLVANTSYELLIQQALQLKPNAVVIGNDEKFKEVSDALWSEGIKVFAGQDAITQAVEMDGIDTVVTAMVGFSGLKPTLNAIEHGKQIALANKETLVVAGDIITKKAQEKGVNIYPVDSEHSAIFQCLVGEFHNPIEKIILTASGGPFRGLKREQLEKISVEDALKHPNWDMGAKITIDSASMMNKGLEVIEAKWLFGLKAEQIEVVVHPQSIIHSMVQFQDGSIKAQMGLPDMKLPIQYALSYPMRLKSEYPRYNFLDHPNLTFEIPDYSSFPNLKLAFECMKKGGVYPCALNAANEVAVQSFLSREISFNQIFEVNDIVVNRTQVVSKTSFETYFETDKESRMMALETIKQLT